MRSLVTVREWVILRYLLAPFDRGFRQQAQRFAHLHAPDPELHEHGHRAVAHGQIALAHEAMHRDNRWQERAQPEAHTPPVAARRELAALDAARLAREIHPGVARRVRDAGLGHVVQAHADLLGATAEVGIGAGEAAVVEQADAVRECGWHGQVGGGRVAARDVPGLRDTADDVVHLVGAGLFTATDHIDGAGQQGRCAIDPVGPFHQGLEPGRTGPAVGIREHEPVAAGLIDAEIARRVRAGLLAAIYPRVSGQFRRRREIRGAVVHEQDFEARLGDGLLRQVREEFRDVVPVLIDRYDDADAGRVRRRMRVGLLLGLAVRLEACGRLVGFLRCGRVRPGRHERGVTGEAASRIPFQRNAGLPGLHADTTR